MMDRRAFLASIAVFAAPCVADAQQAAKVPRIGILPPGPIHLRPHFLEAFRQGLRELGYVEGQNIMLELPSADVTPERLAALAAELVGRKVDVIVTWSTAIQAARQATRTIPIVMAVSADAVELGFVASLARPGGNTTGLSFTVGPEIAGKHLQLLKEAVPKVSRMAFLWNPAVLGLAAYEKETQAAARALGVSLQSLEWSRPDELEPAFSTMTKQAAGALLVAWGSVAFGQRRRIADLAAKHQLPAIYPWREAAEAGGLMAYGASLPDMFRRAASYVDKILKGANPADLPVEQPTKFELVINLKTANALGLTIPQSVLLRADEVIQ